MIKAIIFDMDVYKEKDLKDLIVVTRQYRGPMILATSNPSLLAIFHKFSGHKNQHVAMKPLDISYCNWFLSKDDQES